MPILVLMFTRLLPYLAVIALAAGAQEIRPAPRDCPPSDGWSWSEHDSHPTGRVMWVQTRSEQDFRQLCGQASACAWRFENVTIIVGRNPEWTYGEGLRHHEECHDGWTHGSAPMNGGILR